MPDEQIRIILVDDHKLVREALALLLESDRRFKVIKICVNGIDAIESVRLLQPDILLIDINMEPLNGFEVTEKITKENNSIKIIGLSVNNLPSYAEKMLSIGARGYMTKSSSFHEIVHAILEVHNGNTYIAEEVKKMIL